MARTGDYEISTIGTDPELATRAAIDSVDEFGQLRMLSRDALPSGAHVSITAPGRYSAEGEVVYCDQHNGWYRHGIRVTRRRHARFAIDEAAWLTVFHGSSTAYPVRVIDVSECGLGLVTRVAFEPEALVKVAFRGVFIIAEVRHCTRMGAVAYRVGVEILATMCRDTDQEQTDSPRWWSSVLQRITGE